MKKMNKKGAEMTLTTIVAAILVVVVLIVLVAFFLGGSTAITDTIKRIFFGTTAGYDLNLAIQTCQSRCEAAKDLAETQRARHAYCTSSLTVDRSPVDGEADYIKVSGKKRTVKYFCPPTGYYTNVPNIYAGSPDSTADIGFLDVSCGEFACETPAVFSKGIIGPPAP